MSTFFVLVGMLAFLAGIIMLFINLFKKKPKKIPFLLIIGGFIVFVVGGVLSNDSGKKTSHQEVKSSSVSSSKKEEKQSSSDISKEKTSVSNTDEKNFYDDLAILEDSLNGLGVTSISKGQLDYPAAKITLDSSLGEVSKIDAQNSISDINKKIVAMVANDGTKNPQLSYYIGSIKVAENRSILEPSEVKFTSSLK